MRARIRFTWHRTGNRVDSYEHVNETPHDEGNFFFHHSDYSEILSNDYESWRQLSSHSWEDIQGGDRDV
jgi:hypothetical protein